MLEAGGIQISSGGEIAIPVNYAPNREQTEVGKPAEVAERLAPEDKANEWFMSQLEGLNKELTNTYELLEADRSGQVELLTKLGQIAGEKRALKRSDCPELKPKEKELITTQEEIEEAQAKYSEARAVVLKYHQADPAKAALAHSELEQYSHQINRNIENLVIIGHELRQKKS